MERTAEVEIQALRSLARKQQREISQMRALARRAMMALIDHDLEQIRELLGEIAEGETPSPLPGRGEADPGRVVIGGEQ